MEPEKKQCEQNLELFEHPIRRNQSASERPKLFAQISSATSSDGELLT